MEKRAVSAPLGFRQQEQANARSLVYKRAGGIVTLRMLVHGICVEVKLPEDAERFFLANYMCYLPDTGPCKGSAPELNFTALSDRNGFTVERNGATVANKSSSFWLAIDTILAISKFVERKMNEAGIFSMHSSGIAFGKYGGIVIGDAGSGKTISAIKSCLLNREFRIISGNRVVVQGSNIVGGAPLLRPRVGPLISLPKVGELVKSGNIWERDSKITVMPEELGVKRQTSYPVKLKAIFKVKVLDGKLKVKESVENSAENFEKLYSCLSEFSDRFPVAAYGPRIPYPEMFGLKLRKKRALKAEFLAKSYGIISLEGNFDSIIKYLVNRMKTP